MWFGASSCAHALELLSRCMDLAPAIAGRAVQAHLIAFPHRAQPPTPFLADPHMKEILANGVELTTGFNCLCLHLLGRSPGPARLTPEFLGISHHSRQLFRGYLISL